MLLKDVLTVLDTIAPFDTAEPWDNAGLMVGDPFQEVRSVLVALDPSTQVIHAAREGGMDLIITHHPLIFSPLKRIDLQDNASRRIALLIRASIALVSMHTNLDAAAGGVADELAASLSLKDVQSFGAMRAGMLGDARELSPWARGLPFETVRLVDAGRPVRSVCACPGSGMDYIGQAIDWGCDTFVTGDVRYHAALDAKEAGINVVDLGHFATEEIIIAPLAKRLGRELPGLAIQAYGAQDVFTHIKGENH
ncbi:MAG TPA: Nif3-like dinuclear metal center hexameric protein [Desulfomonilia bacterium]|jgi:dinuclear metal center YbgI/SA1388 family protein|nr:Nif3-like dinuclear metal center hexameric protein [Desulfomonilia bacterium]